MAGSLGEVTSVNIPRSFYQKSVPVYRILVYSLIGEFLTFFSLNARTLFMLTKNEIYGRGKCSVVESGGVQT